MVYQQVCNLNAHAMSTNQHNICFGTIKFPFVFLLPPIPKSTLILKDTSIMALICANSIKELPSWITSSTYINSVVDAFVPFLVN